MILDRPVIRRALGGVGDLARHHALVSGGQLASGAGNLLFALVMARVLEPGEFARLAAFLALYVLAYVFVGSLGAGSAIAPSVAEDLVPRMWRIGFAVSIGLIVGSGAVGALLDLSTGLALALAVTAPVAGPLAVTRGRLYGRGDYRRIAATLVTEPCGRLTLGVALALAMGARGAGMGVALAGWAAFAVAAPEQVGPRWRRYLGRWLPDPPAGDDEGLSDGEGRPDEGLVGADASTGAASGGRAGAGGAVAVFFLLAVLMNQDLLIANRLLPDDEAARFAVLSTLGGVAAFATTTVPLVLLGHGDRRGALKTALGVAGGLGGGAVLLVAVAPELLVSLAFGTRYADIGALAVPYVGAMALLGLVRVFAARLCAVGWGRAALWGAGGIAVLQAALLIGTARNAAEVAFVTLGSTTALTLGLAGLVGLQTAGGLRSLADRVRSRRFLAGRLEALRAVTERVREDPLLIPERLRGLRSLGEGWLPFEPNGDGRSPVVSDVDAPRTMRFAHVVEDERPTEVLPAPDEGVAPSPPGEEPPQKNRPGVLEEVSSRGRRWAAETVEAVRRSASDPAVRGVAAVTLLALVIRLVIPRSLWLDEAIAVSQAKMPFREMLEQLRYGDVHPPGHSALLWGTVRILGTSETAVRFPSVIAGTLLVPALYVLGRRFYGRATGLIAAGLATVAPFLVWYSQEARMYAFFMLFAVGTAWAQDRVLREGGRARDWAAYALFTAALLWVHYFALLWVLVQQLIFLGAVLLRFKRGRPVLRLALGWVAAMAVVAVALLPLVPILRDQLIAYGNRQGAGLSSVPAQTGSPATSQQGLSIYAVLANVVWAVWGYHSDATMVQIAALWPLGLLGTLFLLGRGRSRPTSLLLALALGPMLGFLAVAVVRRDLFELRYFAPVAPVLLLLIARGVTGSFRRPLGRVVVAGVLIGSMAVGLADQQLNGANPRTYDFRGALSEVGERAEPSDAVLYAPRYLQPVIDYYAPDLEAQSIGREPPEIGEGRVFLLGSFLDKPEVAGATGGALHTLDERRELVDRFERPQVKVWVFR